MGKKNKCKVVKYEPPCHVSPTQVLPGLWLGKGSDQSIKHMIDSGVNVLVDLIGTLDHHVWEWGFTGEILYIPIEDFKTLPWQVYWERTHQIAQMIEDGKQVGIFCLGGHGRTGYMAAGVVGLLLPDLDPVAFLRKKYCKKAVETYSQREHIEKLTGHDLGKHDVSFYRGYYWLEEDDYVEWWNRSRYGTTVDIETYEKEKSSSGDTDSTEAIVIVDGKAKNIPEEYEGPYLDVDELLAEIDKRFGKVLDKAEEQKKEVS